MPPNPFCCATSEAAPSVRRNGSAPPNGWTTGIPRADRPVGRTLTQRGHYHGHGPVLLEWRPAADKLADRNTRIGWTVSQRPILGAVGKPAPGRALS